MSEVNKGRIMYAICIAIVLWCFLILFKNIDAFPMIFNIIAYIVLACTLFQLCNRVQENEDTWRD